MPRPPPRHEPLLTPNALGTYILVLFIRRDFHLEVGALGVLNFKAGRYLYVGSAMSGLGVRIRRHLNKGKLAHWHIDHLTNAARIDGAAVVASRERLECIIAGRLETRSASVAGFGCSDCKCRSHLFLVSSAAEAWENAERAITGLGADRRLMSAEKLRDFLNQR